MHHIALDRAGPHNRHFNHKIINIARFQPRQHVDLGTAFDLKHADRITITQHVIDRRIVTRHGQIRLSVIKADQIKGLADTGQHPECQNINLHDAQRVDIVLVPLDKIPILHRGGTNRHDRVQPILREHKTAHMLRQVARKAA